MENTKAEELLEPSAGASRACWARWLKWAATIARPPDVTGDMFDSAEPLTREGTDCCR